MRTLLRLALAFALVMGAVAISTTAFTATNTVPKTFMMNKQIRNYSGNDPLKAQDFAPPECNSIRASLQRIVYIGGTPGSPSNQSELILGTAVNNTINALGGADCVLGGAGNDTLGGAAGNDVLIGGPGTDSVAGGTGTDVCYGEIHQGGCETFISPG